MVYMHVTINCRMGKMEQFSEAFSHRIPVLESYGWKFLGGWHNVFGRVARVVHLWELPDANAYQSVLSQAAQNPEFAKVGPAINESVQDEIIEIMTSTPYGR